MGCGVESASFRKQAIVLYNIRTNLPLPNAIPRYLGSPQDSKGGGEDYNQVIILFLPEGHCGTRRSGQAAPASTHETKTPNMFAPY